MKLWRRGGVEDEIRHHLEEAIRDRMDRGESRAEAEAAARREFGNALTVMEVTREIDGHAWLSRLAQDLRYGLRMLVKNPTFALAAILSLAVGIGATTAIFRIIDAVRLRSLPVSNPQELARIRLEDATGARGNFHGAYDPLTNPIFQHLRRTQEAFTDIAVWSAESFDLSTGGEMRPVRGLIVSGGLFDVLGVKPAFGRLLTDADDRRGCAPLAVLSHAFWQREFGGNPAALGRTLTLNGHPAEIVGVTPPEFLGLDVGRSFDVAAPLCADATVSGGNRLDSGTDWWLVTLGRLKPGWTAERATAHLRAASPALFEATLPPTYPAASVKRYREFRLQAIGGQAGDSSLRQQYEPALWILWAAAGVVLAIACANVANLLLARATAREREIAIRLGLGASRARVVRQLLTESALLAVLGAAGGVMLAGVMSEALVSFFSTTTDSVVLVLRTDARVLAFTSALAVVTCLLFGLAPALRATRGRASAALKGAGRGLVGADRAGMRRALVAAQVALAMVLIVGGILFTRTLTNLHQFDTGFRRSGVLLAGVDMRRLALPMDRRIDTQREILDHIRAIPGVRAAASASVVPVSGSSSGNDVMLDGTPVRVNARFNRVSPGFFRTLGIPMVAGRDFEERDTFISPRVAIVDETFAASVMGGGSPVGRTIRVEPTSTTPETPYEIVGLVKASVYEDLRERRAPTVFVAAAQAPRPFPGARVLIHSDLDAAAIAPAVTRALADLDPRISVAFRSFDRQIEDTVVRERLLAMLANFFAAVAAVLALLGLYGVIAYGVARRTNEVGVRMALGATQRAVLAMFLKEAAFLVVAGVAAGIPLALATARLARTLLFGIDPSDPWTLASAAAALLWLGLLATYWPARAATRIEAATALRVD